MQNDNLTDKWSEEILGHGYTVLPNLLIRHAHKLGLTSPRFQVLATIESFRWDSSHPWPSQQTIADITGYSITQINRITTDLQIVGIEKIKREGRSCLYDMSGLIDELNDIA